MVSRAGRRRWAWILAGALAPLAVGVSVRAADLDEFKIKREQVFEFTERPTVTGQGDRFEIRFASKGYCDATVAIEDAAGRIVRHLASGCLGANAPAPFQKNSLTQALGWDGKDDQGRYVENRGSCSVRVSLGLRARFERTLYWSGQKQVSGVVQGICPTPEGVYVFDGWVVDSLKLFDHHGDYVRTVYPFPADKLATIKDLRWHSFPQDNARLPLKEGEHQSTLFGSGDNAGFKDFGIGPKHQEGSAGSALAWHNGRLALAKIYLSRVGSDGSSGGLAMKGPKTGFTDVSRAPSWRGGGKPVEAVPRSAAFSPDGRWLYTAGHHWVEYHGTGGHHTQWLHGVARLDYAADGPPQVFAGKMTTDALGAGDGQFNVPAAVACDSQGRVYVADYMNDRIVVYLPDGKLHKKIPVNKPADLSIDPRSGEIYVFSWTVRNRSIRERDWSVEPTLTRLGPLDDPRPRASFPLPIDAVNVPGGSDIRVAVDWWADQPTIWLTPGTPRWGGGERRGLRLLAEKDKQLTLVRDFGRQVKESVIRDGAPGNLRQRLYVNPKNGALYLAEGDAGQSKSTGRLLQIDPQTGRLSVVELPFDAEDFAFDPEGRLCMRALREIGRFDPQTWREVPFDYGEERAAANFASSAASGAGMRRSPLLSGLPLPVHRYNHHGGMMVSPRGHVAVGIHGGQEPEADRREGAVVLEGGDKYSFRIYPGRSTAGLVLVFDEHGKLVHDDAVPGIAFMHGVGIDRDDSLYVMAMAARVLDGQRYFNEATDTLMKFAPGQGKILATHNKTVPLPVPADMKPKRPFDLSAPGGGRLAWAWVEGGQWFYGGLGFHARHSQSEGYGCDCFNSRFSLDYFARSFAPEVDHYSVAVLDSSGNLILRVGRYGNVDDGRPMIPAGGPAKTRALGGDEVSLFHACYVATHTDRRLFVADVGNQRIVSVKLDYHVDERVALKDR